MWLCLSYERWLPVFFEEQRVGKLYLATLQVDTWRQQILNEGGERNSLVHIQLHVLIFVRIKELWVFHLQLTDRAILQLVTLFVGTTCEILFCSNATFFVNYDSMNSAFSLLFLLNSLINGFPSTCLIGLWFDVNITTG